MRKRQAVVVLYLPLKPLKSSQVLFPGTKLTGGDRLSRVLSNCQCPQDLAQAVHWGPSQSSGHTRIPGKPNHGPSLHSTGMGEPGYRLGLKPSCHSIGTQATSGRIQGGAGTRSAPIRKGTEGCCGKGLKARKDEGWRLWEGETERRSWEGRQDGSAGAVPCC